MLYATCCKLNFVSYFEIIFLLIIERINKNLHVKCFKNPSKIFYKVQQHVIANIKSDRFLN